jgi:hypothetical protein
MLKIIKKIYNCIYIFHKSITKKSYFGLTNMGIVFLIIILVYGLTNKFVSSENVINLFNEVLVYFLRQSSLEVHLSGFCTILLDKIIYM